MSRIGRQPVSIPDGVTISVKDGEVSVKGPKGQLSQAVVEHVEIDFDDKTLNVRRTAEIKQAKANHGLMRALIQNMVDGVTKGFSKDLEIQGIGYRADVRGKNLVLNLGYSHPIEYAIPDGIDISVDKQNRITVAGVDKQLVGHVAAKIRSYREPDHYKGKGVRYVGEYVYLKAGKSA
jgi:large subunit ribosomal protein L6